MYDVIVVGAGPAGPAGASAALFTAKAGKRTLMIDNDKSMTKKAWVENHYGVKAVTGPDLVETGIEQAKKFGTEVEKSAVTAVISNEETVNVTTESSTYEARHVILATGILADIAEKSGIETVEGTEPRIKTVIKVDRDGKTNKPGVWAAGTCAGLSVHTIITAGHGAEVAINVISDLNGERYVDHDILK
ncbi:FAD-dependent oxidoreductase [Salipaludibacillus agaradhaerens]|uniref:FAD-dependent oxidoreductase n=1 Tax=Salipaludibacillus agaradhaerens TaxID=76935 RepID=UPI0021511461|nr:FAD-dependent oxidoreductase [Salipaludibacillus agaradhaerens]MCR6108054.1 FAD-dependent oxidoreductase [Salipaludibacillus agaradhaerens]MCR6120079.1 FAD-dependent oxidoreductase [Salipaludibacillus agaradhaerens]